MTGPTFSILVSSTGGPTDSDRRTIASVLDQSFSEWEHFDLTDVPADELTSELNNALAVAAGTYVLHLQSPDLLRPDALASIDAALSAGAADVVYSDAEFELVDGGQVLSQRPDWSPERLRSNYYCGGLFAVRRQLLTEVGGYRPGFGEALDHDLALRATEMARTIVHVPVPLVRQPEPASLRLPQTEQDGGRRAVQEHLDRLGLGGRVQPGRIPATFQTDRSLDPNTRVSLIIPTRGTSGSVRGEQRTYVVDAVRSALSHTDHRNIEIVIVYDEGTSTVALDELKRVGPPNLVALPYSLAFNFSQKVNAGFVASSGEIVVLLNDDIEVKSQRWLETLLGPLREPDVGMTGAKLLFEDGSIQHAGHQYSDHEFRNAFRGVPGDLADEYTDLWIDRETTGTTAACAALRREVYEQVGGLTETLPVNFNDVDLSLKIRQAGYRIVWSARTELYHFESRSRVPGAAAWEHSRIDERWGRFLRDPYTPDTRMNSTRGTIAAPSTTT